MTGRESLFVTPSPMAIRGTAARLLWLAEIIRTPRAVSEDGASELSEGVKLLVNALGVAYALLRDEGYFGDPDYPEAQQIAAVFGG